MGVLQESGAEEYRMGLVHVRDRAALESAACECYAIIVREFDRLLGPAASDMTASGRAPVSPLDAVTTEEGGLSTLGDGSPRRDGEV
jgi:hypothetical protein